MGINGEGRLEVSIAIGDADRILGLGFAVAAKNLGSVTVADLTGKAAGDQFGLVVTPKRLFAGVHGNGNDEELRMVLIESLLDPTFGHLNPEPIPDRRFSIVFQRRNGSPQRIVVGGPGKQWQRMLS